MTTERQYLVTLGLAKEGARGRFSREAKAALEAAKAKGMTFESITPVPVAKPKATKTVKVATAPVAKIEHNAKEVRRWAAINGVQVGERGRIHPDVLAQWQESTGGQPTATLRSTLSVDPDASEALKPVRKPAPTRQREENTMWAIDKGNGAAHADLRIQITTCASCSNSVGFCSCKAGPQLPTYLGGGAGLLNRPEV